MFKFKSACYFALVSLLTSSNASAGPVIIKDLKRAKSAWFYNKPGATTEDVSRDDYNCTAFGHYMFTMGPYNDGKPYGPYPGLLGSVFGDAVSSGPIRGNKDDCMMSLGYSRYNTADDSMKSFMARYENLTTEERDLYHGSDIPPEGKITRKWVNTFWITGEGEQKPDVEERNYMPERFDLSKSETLKSVEPSFRGNPSLIQPLVFKSVKKAEGKPITAEFKNNFEMKCPAILGEKMYGVSFPGRPDF